MAAPGLSGYQAYRRHAAKRLSPMDVLSSDPGLYYVSPDRKIWASVGGWNTSAPGDMGVLWLKPLGVTLEIHGRRLDGAAPPLEVFRWWR